MFSSKSIVLDALNGGEKEECKFEKVYRDAVNKEDEKRTPEEKLVVMYGHFDYQVCNGGLEQYINNGYAEKELEDLAEGLSKVKGEISKEIKEAFGIVESARAIWCSVNENVGCNCDECDGSGYVREDCDNCNGSGYIWDEEDGEEKECEECRGDGYVEESCSVCEGDGEMRLDLVLENYATEMDSLDNSYYSLDNKKVLDGVAELLK